jgi:hypothetical protein
MALLLARRHFTKASEGCVVLAGGNPPAERWSAMGEA